jgi:hypothetical protein
MEYLELQSVVKDGSVITDVKFENNRLYFKIDGHLFSTFGNFVHHERNPIFDHAVLDIQCRSHNTAEGIMEAERNSKEIDESLDLWHEHKPSLYKLVFLKGLELYAEDGDENKLVEYVDYHFDIMENGDNCRKLINKLKESDD